MSAMVSWMEQWPMVIQGRPLTEEKRGIICKSFQILWDVMWIWSYSNFKKIISKKYWIVAQKLNCMYRYRAMFDVMPLPLDWPVEVNYHQGRAFCAWKGFGFRLPTEAERNVMKGKKVVIRHSLYSYTGLYDWVLSFELYNTIYWLAWG